MIPKKSLLVLVASLALAGCTGAAEPKASFNSPLFAKPPEVVRLDGQYMVAIFPKPDADVSVSAVAMEQTDGRTFVFASELKKGPAPSPQLFSLKIPPTVEPEILAKAIYWKEPDGWIQPLPVKNAPH